MFEKPTYEELEKRIQELEQAASDPRQSEERKKVKKSLRESEYKLATHLQNTPIGALSWDLDFKIIEWNPAAENIFGFSKAEAIGRHATELILPEDMKKLVDGIFKDLISEKGGARSRNENRTKSGRRIICDWYNTPLKDIAGKVVGIASLVHDVTERTQIFEALKKQKEFNEKLIQTSNAIIIGLDHNHKIKIFNKGAEKITGFKAKEVIGKDWFKIFFKPNIYDEMNKVWETAWGAEYNSYVNPILSKKGNEKIISWQATGIYDSPDVTTHMMISIGDDITERIQVEEALRRSEQLLAATQQLTKVGGWEWDVEEQNMFWTDEVYQIHDSQPADFPSESMVHIGQGLECYGPEDRPIILKAFKDCVEKGQPYDLELPFRTLKGRQIWIRTIAKAIKEKGDVVKVVGNIMDITDRKEREETLRQSEEQFRQIYEQQAVGVARVSLTSQIESANKAYCSMIGYQEEELIGKYLYEITYPEILEENLRKQSDLISGEKDHYRLEKQFIHKTGDIIHGILDANLVRNNKGKPLYFLGSVVDITERRQMDDTLRESEKRYRIIFERSPLAVVRFDPEGTIVDFNDKFVDIMGTTREKLLGFNTAKQSTPKMRETIKKALSGEIVSYEDSYTSVTGGKTTFLRGLFNPVTPGHSPTDVIAALEDITELKKHEEEQQKIEKLESLGILAGGIAHDFNNILTGIMGNLSFSQVLIDADHRAQKTLGEAEKATRRAAELAQQLLTFAKGGEPNKEIVLLPRLVRDAVAFMLRGSNVRPVVNAPNSLSSVWADEGQICQILNNLIINADQAMPGGGTLTITGSNEILSKGNSFNLVAGRYTRLDIQDTGCGISPDSLTKIFDPYFSTKISGTGLGLATAYSIIQRHKGYIGVSSIIGTGTTFFILLPASGTSSEEIPVLTEIITESCKEGSILVMDDEKMIRDIATQMLSYLGYEVTTCADGEEAIELYQISIQSQKEYAAVIMDLTIPGGLGGKETAEHLLAMAPTAYLIVSSGYSNDPVVADFRQYGFSGAITKPYNINDFKKVLSTVPARIAE